MKHITLALSLLALAASATSSAWATCNTNVVDVALVTTVTVTAGPNDSCEWRDNNPNNYVALTVAGLVVPALLTQVDATFDISPTAEWEDALISNSAQCRAQLLGCSAAAPLPDTAGTGASEGRLCKVVNHTASTSATATCIFEVL